MKKVTAFIDGLNLYHSLALNKKAKQHRWLDLKKLCQCFIKKSETLTDIYYFTALAKWDEGKITRHKQYIKALETTDVQVIYGYFKRVTKKCRKCYKEYRTFEEKETDVNIGLHLLREAFQNKFDKFLLLTGDTDLIPVIKMIRKYFPNKESHTISPINSYVQSFKAISDRHSKIKKKHLHKSEFPPTIHLEHGSIIKPKTW